jgi:hypothetical protein
MIPAMGPACIHCPQSSRTGLGNRGLTMVGATGALSATDASVTSTLNPFAGYMMTANCILQTSQPVECL